MRYCPRCGRPKELHDKTQSSARIPKSPAPRTRECLLEDAESSSGIATRRPDFKAYSQRMKEYRSARP